MRVSCPEYDIYSWITVLGEDILQISCFELSDDSVSVSDDSVG